MGVLTQYLLRRGDITTYGAEIDPESVGYLHAHFPEFAPRLIEGDFLKMNLRERFPRGLKISPTTSPRRYFSRCLRTATWCPNASA